MKIRRISYYWLQDLGFAFLYIFLIVSLFYFSFRILNISIKSNTEFLLVLYLFVTPMFSFIIGLRPILGLRKIPDTLYIDNISNLYVNKLFLKFPI